MGMSAGSFNTREFFHSRVGALAMRRASGSARSSSRFALPALLLALVWRTAQRPPWPASPRLLQVPGLLADRWFFFAQAKHPQNLYYQVVSPASMTATRVAIATGRGYSSGS